MTTKTKHSDCCKRVFKNYDLDCPRCQELANGASPRSGWNDLKFQGGDNGRPIQTNQCCQQVYNINPGGYCNVCGSGTDYS